MPLETYLSPEQNGVLCAVLNRIIPPDEFPGALENGVPDYLAQQFAGDLAQALPLYQSGLTAINTEAKHRFGEPFVNLDDTQQDTLLSCVEIGDVQTAWPIAPRHFFEMLVNHAAEGYYGDPGNGGNPQKTSWQMIGFADR